MSDVHALWLLFGALLLVQFGLALVKSKQRIDGDVEYLRSLPSPPPLFDDEGLLR